MPIRTTETKEATHQTMINMSYESRVVAWLMQDGWQVFSPVLDNGHQTDILISDGPHYHRIQIKTVEALGEDHVMYNKWKDSHVDVVVIFARNSNWGYVTPAYQEDTRPLNHPEHQKFMQNKNDFLKAFHKI